MASLIEDRSIPVPESGCWLWEGYCDKDGYGKVYYEGRQHPAHRVSYRLHKGEIPEGMLVCHQCDNPACVNPDHLWLGTHKQNMKDMSAKGRTNRDNSHLRKLTEGDVEFIRAAYSQGYTQYQLADMFNVNQGHISAIINHKKRS